MAITVQPIADASLTDPQEVARVIRQVFLDLEDQLNQNATVYVSSDGVIPAGLPRNALLAVLFKGRISIYIQGAKARTELTAEMIGGLSKQGTQYLGSLSAAVAPVLANFPNDNDWGFFTNTAAATHFLCFNFSGVLRKVALT
jgi:hypothetical protein